MTETDPIDDMDILANEMEFVSNVLTPAGFLILLFLTANSIWT